MQDIDIDLVRCFIAVAELRNFTLAGTRIGRSQSAVSIRIKKLEDIIGVPLLLRNNQDVQLTEHGKLLLPKARRLLDESERLLAEMRGPSVSGQLRIGLLEYIAPHRLPEIMTAMKRRLPGADLLFHVGLSSSLITLLSSRKIDLALALHDPASETSDIVAEDQLLWVESADVERQGNHDTPDLCLMQAPCIYRVSAMEALLKAGLEFKEVMTANSVQSVRNAVRSGLGATVLGSSCLGQGLRPATELNNLGALPAVSLSLHGNDHRKPEVVDLLQSVLRDHIAPSS